MRPAPSDSDRYSIGGLARTTGVNLETIRYYERIGLMPPPERSSGGHRLYSSDHQRRMLFIRRGREFGFSLRDIRELVSLAATDDPCAAVREITSAHLTDVRARLMALRSVESALKSAIQSASPDDLQSAILKLLRDP